MDLRLLESFAALARVRHMGRAARELHVSQPTLTAHLKRLEAELGAELFERRSTGLELTAAGAAFVPHAGEVLRRMRRARDDVLAASQGAQGSMRIGYNHVAGRRVLPGLIRHLAIRYPKLAVSTWERRTGPQIAGIAAGELDLGFSYGYPNDRRFAHRRIDAQIPIVGIVGRDHPLAGRGSVPIAELDDYACVLFDRPQSPQMYDAIISSARAAGVTLDVAVVADDPGASGQLAVARGLVGFASYVRAEALGTESDAPVAVTLVDPIPTVDLYAVWLRERESEVVLQESLRWLESSSLPTPGVQTA
ncbi:LysR family transcriptional regulator [Epidermidibacterium keratini]|uniref:LysR family transcriptional regulator n=1 Tax=Epidermidibacterium keratini TaxID=1891644 RepID=A0A7L4YJZ8_9ACTN|nr:LysR family transcriptional regulator [Epidermidibacterium keratini]QHB98876.1 LysR family transcriptional regulator [Epidermidibacterium keratini]